MSGAMMAGPPPFGAGRLATLENWQRPPFNRWSFQHVRELIPTARIPRGDGPAWDITLDARGNAAADGGISATLRDAGRIGLLALRRGRADGGQVIAPQWFDDTVRGAPDGPGAFLAGDGAGRGYPTGAHYRNCWWAIDPGLPLYCAAGVFGQSVFVHGRAELVVAKLSSWPVASSPPLRTAMVAAVRAIASALRRG